MMQVTCGGASWLMPLSGTLAMLCLYNNASMYIILFFATEFKVYATSHILQKIYESTPQQ